MSEIGSGNGVAKRGRGRPKKDECFDRKYTFKESNDHVYMRKALEKDLGKNGAEVMREALELLYNMKIGWK